jgi:hypothetical protein
MSTCWNCGVPRDEESLECQSCSATTPVMASPWGGKPRRSQDPSGAGNGAARRGPRRRVDVPTQALTDLPWTSAGDASAAAVRKGPPEGPPPPTAAPPTGS